MPLFMYRCPNTGYRVQGFVAEDTSEDGLIYEPVTMSSDTSREPAYRRRLGAKRPNKAAAHRPGASSK
jgi:hypothetical protein